ncbi:hypothetical protein NPIL_574751 [Nephila pilipes]|uniref:Uncharacterized protein n=1 Tax=Nephila pilipes TaxID=299642 RepID=A0A8X6U0D5_NEPPI|nr:hypothetical protein NPIL_574751 [Nephila pilipes]
MNSYFKFINIGIDTELFLLRNNQRMSIDNSNNAPFRRDMNTPSTHSQVLQETVSCKSNKLDPLMQISRRINRNTTHQFESDAGHFGHFNSLTI